MKSLFAAVSAAAVLVVFAAPARANECVGGVCSLPTQKSTVEKALDAQAAPSAREIQSSVDAYLASAKSDASLVGGCGSAGYDGGFWIRGGTFLLKINLTIQARWEGFQWNDEPASPAPGGDLSGFSVPRVTLKFSGDATCDVHYYAELEFGHEGSYFNNSTGTNSFQAEIARFIDNGQNNTDDVIGSFLNNRTGQNSFQLEIGRFLNGQQAAPDDFVPVNNIAREAWIEYEAAPQLAFRMGLIKLPATRQLMTPPEMQQFVDISLASAYIGNFDIGYTDRNRDYGFMLHGALGCDGAWQYMLAVTNGDGAGHRNVLDGSTDDPMAYSARVNWDIMGHMGYEEGALRQRSCDWTAAVGVWANYFIDHRQENTLTQFADRLSWGADLAVGWGGFSLTAAYNVLTWDTVANVFPEVDGISYLAQVGYLFPDTAWEIAARYSLYNHDPVGTSVFGGSEYGFALNYYIDGHADKVTLDYTIISSEKDSNRLADTYAGYNVTGTSDATLIRLQWQLAL